MQSNDILTFKQEFNTFRLLTFEQILLFFLILIFSFLNYRLLKIPFVSSFGINDNMPMFISVRIMHAFLIAIWFLAVGWKILLNCYFSPLFLLSFNWFCELVWSVTQKNVASKSWINISKRVFSIQMRESLEKRSVVVLVPLSVYIILLIILRRLPLLSHFSLPHNLVMIALCPELIHIHLSSCNQHFTSNVVSVLCILYNRFVVTFDYV